MPTLLNEYLDRVAADVSHSLSDDDHMYSARGDLQAYLTVGRDALRVITLALLAANRADPTSILDFGCGAGRVTRWMRAAYPDAKIAVSDLREDSVAFVVEEFDAEAIPSTPSLDDLQLTGSYDLIWLGSVFTHISEPAARALLDQLHEALAPGGVLVFTTHGRRVVQNQIAGRHDYIEASRFTRLLAQAAATGYGHAPHVDGGWSGISVTDASWLTRWCAESLDRRMVSLSEMAWSNHQDVVAVARQPI